MNLSRLIELKSIYKIQLYITYTTKRKEKKKKPSENNKLKSSEQKAPTRMINIKKSKAGDDLQQLEFSYGTIRNRIALEY